MARMSGEEGVWPMGPAAKPANPAPSGESPSMAETGTILAHGLPCMSTNMAKRNSTPSRLVAAVSSAAFVLAVASRSSVLVTADHLPLVVSCQWASVNDVAPRETTDGYWIVSKCCVAVNRFGQVQHVTKR